MKTVLIQLPVPDPSSAYTRANVPLAAGYLKAYARAQAGRAADEIDIIPQDLADHGGDAAIVEWVLANGYRLVGFTLYLWNRERSLHLAARMKARDSSIIVVVGGPEVSRDVVVPHDSPVDVWVEGEGERVFFELWRNTGRDCRSNALRRGSMLDLSTVPNPYLSGVLAPASGSIIHFERMRGCPGRCAYCHYGKRFSRLRHFPEGMVDDLFALARRSECGEMYFMDPTFNFGGGVADYLRRVARSNSSGIPIHTEARLELVTPELGDLMRKAGIRSVEAGLQSVNPKALAAVLTA
ncbi:MAG: radical SAM protein [Chitinivibrionia bacterium]|nr:radical SAM protein [Chitinivibrionia bacterium]